MGKIHTMLLVLSNTSAFIDIHLVIRPNKITKRDYVMMSWFLFKIELLHILRIFPLGALSFTNPPATVGSKPTVQTVLRSLKHCKKIMSDSKTSARTFLLLDQRTCRILAIQRHLGRGGAHRACGSGRQCWSPCPGRHACTRPGSSPLCLRTNMLSSVDLVFILIFAGSA